jgi:hypothetical protein
VGCQYGLFPPVYIELNLLSKSTIKGIHPSSLSLKEAVIDGYAMFEEGPPPKSFCKAASRKGDVGVNEKNERSYNLDKDRK